MFYKYQHREGSVRSADSNSPRTEFNSGPSHRKTWVAGVACYLTLLGGGHSISRNNEYLTRVKKPPAYEVALLRKSLRTPLSRSAPPGKTYTPQDSPQHWDNYPGDLGAYQHQSSPNELIGVSPMMKPLGNTSKLFLTFFDQKCKLLLFLLCWKIVFKWFVTQLKYKFRS